MKGYARRSSKKDKEASVSIPAQKERLIQKFGIKESDFYVDDGKTASLDEGDFEFELTENSFIVKFNINKRPDFRRMLFDAKNGDPELLKEGLAVWKWDRFARSQAFQKLIIMFLKKCGVKVQASDDTNDPLGMDIWGMFGEKERDKTKERINFAKQYKFDLGLYIGVRRKFGYKWDKKKFDGKEYMWLVPDPEEKKKVIAIFNDSLKKGYKEICKEYDLYPQTYYNLIRDDFYIGMIHCKDQVKKGLHEAIISEELFNKVNKK